MDPDTVSHGIQLAVAPVFLLTAVSGMIGAVAQRWRASLIAHARLETRIKQAHPSEDADGYAELAELRTRGLLANTSIAPADFVRVFDRPHHRALFLGETIDFPGLRISTPVFWVGWCAF